MTKTHRDGRNALLSQKIVEKRTVVNNLRASIELFSHDLRIAENSLRQMELAAKDIQKNKTLLKTTDHAFVRWLERVKLVPVDVFKQELLDTMPKYLPDGIHTLGGFEYVIKDNIIVTVQSHTGYKK